MSADTHSDLQVAQGTDAVRIPNAIKSGFPITINIQSNIILNNFTYFRKQCSLKFYDCLNTFTWQCIKENFNLN